jgi:LytS/YehU family sensor histidine kinase
MIVLKINVTFSRIFTSNLVLSYIITFSLTFIFVTVRLLREKELERNRFAEIEKQKNEIELFALRNQIDSHFLFNTLNNIYGLSLAKSDLAPKSVLLLSEILSFVLYETKKDFYPLANEINIINNFIELEKMRWGDDVSITFDVNGDLDNSFITPLILFTFVENSFKHGIAKTLHNPWVKINLSKTVNEICFEIENCIPTKSMITKPLMNDGIGLENIKRRLNLLYPNSYYLVSKISENSFYIRLTINSE